MTCATRFDRLCLGPRRLLLALLLALSPFLRQAEGADARDFAFLFTSDPHIGSESPKAKPPVTREQNVDRAKRSVSNMLHLATQPCPILPELPGKEFKPVARPRWALIAGDLTDDLAWPLFETVFPNTGLGKGEFNLPVYLCVGNHDGPADGVVRQGVISRNQTRARRGELSGISSNGLHYAWVEQGVHFVCVNLCPADSTDPETPFKYGQPGAGSWNDPAGALQFLSEYLLAKTDPQTPILIWQHYGYCEGFNFDWNWWSARQRRAFYEIVKDRNLVALLHGHTHAPAHYRWPDPKESPQEVQRLFGDRPPDQLRSFEVFSAGSVGAGSFYLFRVLGDRLFALHYNGSDWSKDPRMLGSLSLRR